MSTIKEIMLLIVFVGSLLAAVHHFSKPEPIELPTLAKYCPSVDACAMLDMEIWSRSE